MGMNYLLDDPQLKEKLYFTKTHDWVYLDGRIAYVGVTKYKCAECKDEIAFEMSGVFTYKREGSTYGKVHCGNKTFDITMPVSGKLVQVNRQLLTKPKADLLELKVPDNWLGMILPDEIETSQLLTAKDYLEILSAKQ
jgi:glycine cleavage system H protein